MKKLTILAAGAVGYVLGSRAGRERYEQIKRRAQKTWDQPVVQSAVDDVEQAVRSKASDVGTKVADVASDAGSKVAQKVAGHADSAESEPVVIVPAAPATEGPAR